MRRMKGGIPARLAQKEIALWKPFRGNEIIASRLGFQLQICSAREEPVNIINPVRLVQRADRKVSKNVCTSHDIPFVRPFPGRSSGRRRRYNGKGRIFLEVQLADRLDLEGHSSVFNPPFLHEPWSWWDWR